MIMSKTIISVRIQAPIFRIFFVLFSRFFYILKGLANQKSCYIPICKFWRNRQRLSLGMVSEKVSDVKYLRSTARSVQSDLYLNCWQYKLKSPAAVTERIQANTIIGQTKNKTSEKKEKGKVERKGKMDINDNCGKEKTFHFISMF